MSIGTFIKSTAALTLVIGLVIGVIGAGVSGTMIHETSDTEFCVSCHVYDEFYPRFQESVHQANASGVQAECSDCHIPHDSYINMVAHKTKSGLSDMWAYHVEGINTPEKFDEVLPGLAEHVWGYYLDNDSKQCRSCHNPDGWDYEAQGAAAAAVHKQAVQQGQTCIECHRGIAHAIPDGATYPPPGYGASGDDAEGDGQDDTPTAAEDTGSTTEGEPQTEAEVTKAETETETESGVDEVAESESESTATATEPQDERESADASESTPEDTTEGDDARVADAASEFDGEQLFSDCRACHGNFAPAPDELAQYDLPAFREKMGTHQNVGGIVSNKTPPQIEAIHRYLKTLVEPESNPTADTAVTPGLIQVAQADAASDYDGGQIFAECSACHGSFAPAPEDLAKYDRATFKELVANHQNVGGIVSGKTPAQIEAVYTYLQGL